MNTAVYAVLVAFAANVILCPILIPHLIRFKFGEVIRGDGPASHAKKSGTPTMGGIMIIGSFLLAAFLFARGEREAFAIMLATAGFGLIGLLDDMVKIFNKRSMGLRAYQKFAGQIVVSVAFLLYWRTLPGYDTTLLIPFLPELTFDMGILFIPFCVLVFLSVTNGSNLTDGLDGLAAGVAALIATFFMFAAWAAGSHSLPVTGAAVGSLMGFLLFNTYPARVFMGNTGSLALGGYIAAVAVILRMPLFLCIVAIIYVIESLSVIIQVGYFRATRKRFFKMAPIHHSFELSGWPESKIVSLFYVITAMACLVGYLAMRGLA
jgi:phospho-N-acetylmuramoyl-pentapeptide-transferase